MSERQRTESSHEARPQKQQINRVGYSAPAGILFVHPFMEPNFQYSCKYENHVNQLEVERDAVFVQSCHALYIFVIRNPAQCLLLEVF